MEVESNVEPISFCIFPTLTGELKFQIQHLSIKWKTNEVGFKPYLYFMSTCKERSGRKMRVVNVIEYILDDEIPHDLT
jgi:hypothetical protein